MRPDRNAAVPVLPLLAAVSFAILLAAEPPGRASVDTPLPLGEAIEVEPINCRHPGRCITLEVTCSQVAEPASVTLNVRSGRDDSRRGTILFATGGGGRGYWSGFSRAAKRAVNKLRRKGFRTVQLSWNDLWLNGAEGALEGQANLACRPATVAQWVWENLHTPDQDGAAFCGTGNSGGSAQMSYMVSHYGLADKLDAIVPSGGPPMGRVDLGCLRSDEPPPNDFFKVYAEGPEQIIDRGFGFYRGDGPCDTSDATFEEEFFDASIAGLDLDNYVYPETLIWFVFGENDTGSAVGQGLIFHDTLIEAGSPLVELDFVPDTPHAVPSSKKGANFIRDVLLAGCVP